MEGSWTALEQKEFDLELAAAKSQIAAVYASALTEDYENDSERESIHDRPDTKQQPAQNYFRR